MKNSTHRRGDWDVTDVTGVTDLTDVTGSSYLQVYSSVLWSWPLYRVGPVSYNVLYDVMGCRVSPRQSLCLLGRILCIAYDLQYNVTLT